MIKQSKIGSVEEFRGLRLDCQRMTDSHYSTILDCSVEQLNGWLQGASAIPNHVMDTARMLGKIGRRDTRVRSRVSAEGFTPCSWQPDISLPQESIDGQVQLHSQICSTCRCAAELAEPMLRAKGPLLLRTTVLVGAVSLSVLAVFAVLGQPLPGLSGAVQLVAALLGLAASVFAMWRMQSCPICGARFGLRASLAREVTCDRCAWEGY